MLPALAAESSASVQAAFLRGEYDSVNLKTQRVLDQKLGDPDQMLYLQGTARLKLRDWSGAEESLRRMMHEHPKSVYHAYAQLVLAAAQQEGGDPVGASKTYQTLLKDRRAENVWPQASYALGQLQRSMGLWEKAKDSLRKVDDALVQKQSFHFTVQVGAFSEQRNARRLQDELQKRGFDADLSMIQVSGRPFHRVRVGKFSNRLEAAQEAEKLRKAGFPVKIIP